MIWLTSDTLFTIITKLVNAVAIPDIAFELTPPDIPCIHTIDTRPHLLCRYMIESSRRWSTSSQQLQRPKTINNIIIIIFHFYIVLNTNVSKHFKDIHCTITPVIGCNTCPHTLCTISDSLGSIPVRRYLTLTNCLTNNDGRILPGTHLTPRWRVF